jgi:hypothetical protein
MALDLEGTKVVLRMRIVGVMKVVERSDRSDDALDELTAECGNASRYEGGPFG